MPETIPKSIIVRQMLGNVGWTIMTGTRAAVVLTMWFLVLPYIVYWLTRFYFWSGGQSFAPTPDSIMVNGEGNATTVVGNFTTTAAGVRFVGFGSWYEWYQYARENTTATPIVSRTGVLDGATNTALILYTLTRFVIKSGAHVLKATLGISIPVHQLDKATDSVAELMAKCLEGGVVTAVTIVVFMVLFILRDWIYANAPVVDNFEENAGDDIHIDVEPAEAAELAHAEPRQQLVEDEDDNEEV
ncbi:hypothetical protein GGI04_006184, partial [Coemansia thaxteri]